MRTIKFRAWDESAKFMHLQNDDTLGEFFSAREYQTKIGNSFHIMQFTGLLDKNGKEIFEGDVLEKMDFIRYEKGVVEYRLSSFKIIWINPLCNHSNILHNNAPTSEIIGNIYESPELLKQSK